MINIKMILYKIKEKEKVIIILIMVINMKEIL